MLFSLPLESCTTCLSNTHCNTIATSKVSKGLSIVYSFMCSRAAFLATPQQLIIMGLLPYYTQSMILSVYLEPSEPKLPIIQKYLWSPIFLFLFYFFSLYLQCKEMFWLLLGFAPHAAGHRCVGVCLWVSGSNVDVLNDELSSLQGGVCGREI